MKKSTQNLGQASPSNTGLHAKTQVRAAKWCSYYLFPGLLTNNGADCAGQCEANAWCWLMGYSEMGDPDVKMSKNTAETFRKWADKCKNDICSVYGIAP